MNKIIFKDFNLGGISDSQWQGLANSVESMYGFDIHSKPGILKVNQKLSKESISIGSYPVKRILQCSDGNTYLFQVGSSTNIIKRTSAGVYSTVSGVALNPIMDVDEYDGYIYFTTQNYVGRVPVGVGVDTNWTLVNQLWGSFGNKDSLYHPCKIVEDRLYIGDGNYIASVTRTDDLGTGSIRTSGGTTVTGTGTAFLTEFQKGDFIKFSQRSIYGAGKITSVGTAVTGSSGASFTTEVLVGDYIVYSGQNRQVTAITDDTHLTIASAFAPEPVNATYQIYSHTNGVVYQKRVTSVTDNTHLVIDSAFSVDALYATYHIIHHEFTSDALDIALNMRVRSLGSIDNDLLIGTYSNIVGTNPIIYRWDCYGATYNMPDNVYENGINAFLQSDNLVLVSVGDKGALYYYDGSHLENYKDIPGDWSLTNGAYIDINASLSFNGITLFGLTYTSGKPVIPGIYSIGGYDRNYPKVLNCEYWLSFGNIECTDVKIYAMTKISETVFLVSWSYMVGVSEYWGVDKLDFTKTQPYTELTTRVINVDRGNHKVMNGFISYKSFPADWIMYASYSKDYSASFTNITLVQDTDRNLFYFKESIEEANTVQIKLVIAQLSTVNTIPEIESIELSFD